MLGKRLKELRGKRTQQEIADLLGISRARYSHYENEHVQPDNEILQKMAELHNVTVDYLLGRESKTTYDYLPPNVNELIIKEIVQKYNVDLSEPGNKEKLEQIIRLVLDDRKKQ